MAGLLQDDSTSAANGIPYSGKFSLVQNFTELLVNSLEEFFVVLIIASSPHGDHTHIAMGCLIGHRNIDIDRGRVCFSLEAMVRCYT